MRRRLRAILLAAFLLAAIAGHCVAQIPEGGPMPLSTVKKDEVHTSFRIGYNANSEYTYPGEYRADGNFFANGRSSAYGLGDIFIESRIKPGHTLGPNRMWGTFEAGVRTTVSSKTYVDIFLRHQSAHNVESLSGPDSMWEDVGARYHRATGNCDIWASAAYYTRRIYLTYSSDCEVHATYRHGSLFGRPVSIDGDLHYVAEANAPRAGFFDYDIEPSVSISKRMSVYVDYGVIHDEDQPDGRTDIPVIVGAKVDL